MRIHLRAIATAIIAAALPQRAPAQAAAHAPARSTARRPILAVFAHPDDERVIGPLLSRLAREGRETHLVIATDGSQGTRAYAKIPAGAQLAAARERSGDGDGGSAAHRARALRAPGSRGGAR